MFRRLHIDDRLKSYWDYRSGGAFHQHRGSHIDLVLASAPLAGGLPLGIVDRNARKESNPPICAPVLVDFDP